jgi:hypothetical protein
MWHQNGNSDASMAIFRLLWSGCRGDIKIMNIYFLNVEHDSVLVLSLALSKPELKIFLNVHNLFNSQAVIADQELSL